MLHLALMPLAQLTPQGPTPSTIPGAASAPFVVPNPAGQVVNPTAGSPVATTSQPGTTQPDPVKPSPLAQFMSSVGPIILMVVVLYFVLFRGPKKEEKKRKAMLSEMKKGDTVMTIGGLIARIVSIDGDNIVLKIDESANVKATYTKRSIQQVITDEDKAK